MEQQLQQAQCDNDDRFWKELVGLTGKEAEDAIKKRCPHLTVEIIPKGSSVTRDIRDDRVRVYLDENGKVAQPPRIE